ncbi:hypothetical protein V491_08056 [Pseudogymnoascus sp. VKM F-3775]|nr:hypothetical protein V491_08056 [Pseudogymnoascus sp. VKM F-3775]
MYTLVGFLQGSQMHGAGLPYPSNEHETIAPTNFYNNNAQAGYAVRLPYPSNEDETIALNNFDNYDAQAGYAAPRNNLMARISTYGEPVASAEIAAQAPANYQLSSSLTKKTY